MKKLLHFFDRKRLLQRKWLRFMALEKSHEVYRNYAELTDILVAGKRTAGSIKALIKVNIQNTELHGFGFVVRKQRHADTRHPLQQLFDLMRQEGQVLRIRPEDDELAIRIAVNAVFDARSYHVHLREDRMFPEGVLGGAALEQLHTGELAPAGFALMPLQPAEEGFFGTILPAGREHRAHELLDLIRNS